MPYGYVLYRTSSIGDISKAGGADLILDIGKFGDRANVFVDKVAIIFFYIYISSIVRLFRVRSLGLFLILKGRKSILINSSCRYKK